MKPGRYFDALHGPELDELRVCSFTLILFLESNPMEVPTFTHNHEQRHHNL